MGSLGDAVLIRRSALGDREAFATLYGRHHAMVYRFARLMTGSSSVAEDVVQEVFLALMRDGHRYDPTRAAFSTYVYGIARRQTYQRRSRDRHFVAIDDEIEAMDLAASGDIAASLEQREELRRLRRAILSLPRKYREVVVLCDLQDLTYQDAAAALGCAIGTIRSRLHRARQFLMEKMGRTRMDAADPEPLTMRCTT